MHKNFILASLFVVCSLFASAQRYTDLSIRLEQPVTGDTIFTGIQFSISAHIKNIGADTIRLTDSVAFELSFDGSPISFNFGSGFVPYIPLSGKELLPGDSSGVNFSFTANKGWSTGSSEVCVAVYLLNTVDTLLDTLNSNDTSCATIWVKDPPNSVGNINTIISGLRVYPNPSKGVTHFEMQLAEPGEVQILIADVTGKTMIDYSRKVQGTSKETLSVNTGDLPAGMYIYTIKSGTEQSRGKLEVR